MAQTKSAEDIAAHKILDFILNDEEIRNMGDARIISTLRCIANSMENTSQEKPTADMPKVSKQAMSAAREYIGARIALALWVSPQEKKVLQAMGYSVTVWTDGTAQRVVAVKAQRERPGTQHE